MLPGWASEPPPAHFDHIPRLRRRQRRRQWRGPYLTAWLTIIGNLLMRVSTWISPAGTGTVVSCFRHDVTELSYSSRVSVAIIWRNIRAGSIEYPFVRLCSPLKRILRINLIWTCKACHRVRLTARCSFLFFVFLSSRRLLTPLHTRSMVEWA